MIQKVDKITSIVLISVIIILILSGTGAFYVQKLNITKDISESNKRAEELKGKIIKVQEESALKNALNEDGLYSKEEDNSEVKDETAEWNKGSLDDITFKYPDGWELTKSPEQEVGGLFTKSFILKNETSGATYTFVQNAPGRGGPVSEFSLSFDVKVVKDAVKVDNLTMTKVEADNAFYAKGVTAVMVSFERNSDSYTIFFEGASSDYKKEGVLFEQISETINFTS